MPTDRIEELRALRKLERVVHDGGELLSWANAADTLRGALYDDCDALLDCAEALIKARSVLSHTIPTFGWSYEDGAVIDQIDAALAKLEGGER